MRIDIINERMLKQLNDDMNCEWSCVKYLNLTTFVVIKVKLDSDITDTEILNVINKYKNNTPIFIK